MELKKILGLVCFKFHMANMEVKKTIRLRCLVEQTPEHTLSCSSVFCSTANFGSNPAMVGRKNGAAFGALGGSFGLFLC